jgi:hypothetical protein
MTTGLAIDDIMHELMTEPLNASKPPTAAKHLAIAFLTAISRPRTFTSNDITAYSHRIDKYHRHYHAW